MPTNMSSPGEAPVPPRVRRRQLTLRIIRPVPLAHGETGTGIRFDLTTVPTTHLTMIGEAIAADRARYDLTALATGIAVVGEAVAAASCSASRKAHRNGVTAPGWVTATNLITHGTTPPEATLPP